MNLHNFRDLPKKANSKDKVRHKQLGPMSTNIYLFNQKNIRWKRHITLSGMVYALAELAPHVKI